MELKQSVTRLRPRSDVDYVSQDRTVLITALDGFVHTHEEQGLFVYQARVLSRYRWAINGEPPQLVASSNIEQHSSMAYYVTKPPSDPKADAAQQSIELRLTRRIGQGMHEDVEITNHTQKKERLTLALELAADFADQAQASKGTLAAGQIRSEWGQDAGEWQLTYDYTAEHEYDHQGERGAAKIHLGTIVRVDRSDSSPERDGDSISFQVEVGPHECWTACISAIAVRDGKALPLEYECGAAGTETVYERKRNVFLAGSTHFLTPQTDTLSSVVEGALERGKRDLAALRLYDLDIGERGWVPAAGLPTYMALFGRDTLSAAWQAGVAGADMMTGTLAALRDTQATETNDWRDAQPGRILHQANTGPAAMLKMTPLGCYYGDHTVSPFYAFALSTLWHWTGDRDLVGSFLDTAVKGMEWADKYARLRPGVFTWYQTRSKDGLKNQGWKDSSDAIVYEDGRQVEAPIATCESQGYEYASKLRLAELLWWFERRDEAQHYYDEAQELKNRFNEAFWMEDEGFVAMALDPDLKQVKSIASNPGHAMASAIIDESRVKQVADRLMSPELFSGWGVRTLSAKHPAYNPFAYHRGTVWPAEQAVLSLAFMRYGLFKYAQRLAKAQFEAATMFDFFRMPEVFSGHPRDEEHPFPAFYPRSDSPQAWSASAPMAHLQALLGLFPFAPLKLLVIDPHLPEWLPELTLRGLHVGDAVAEIRFLRNSDGTSSYHVNDIKGTLHVVRQPSPWSLTAGFGERVKDALTSLLPGK